MANTNGHPDETTWDLLAGGELDAAARDAAFDHITGCDTCTRIWRGVLTLKSEAQAQGLMPPDAPARARWMRSPVMGLALAATLVLVISGIVVTRRPVDDTTALRGSVAVAVEHLTATTTAVSSGVVGRIMVNSANGSRYEAAERYG